MSSRVGIIQVGVAVVGEHPVVSVLVIVNVAQRSDGQRGQVVPGT